MHTVELLELALHAAEQLGYQVRHDWLGGSGGGACELKGQKFLVLDLAQSPSDQLDFALDAIARCPSRGQLPLAPELAAAVARRAA